MSGAPQTGWWEEFFPGPWTKIVRHDVDPERARREAEEIINLLELVPGSRGLDIPCGPGRHAVEIAARGINVTGIDLVGELLEIARQNSTERGVDVSWVQGDMREFDAGTDFDAAWCYFGSFGYFSDDDNMKFLRGVAGALRPGGRFLLETVNAETILPRFQSRGWHRKGDVFVLEDRRYDHVTSRIESEWTVMSSCNVERTHVSIRLYTYRELAVMFRACGLTIDRALETGTGRPFALGSSRLTLVAVKDHANPKEI